MTMRPVTGSRMLMLPAVPWTMPRANASNPTWTTCSRRRSSNIPRSTPYLSRPAGSCELAADHAVGIDGSQHRELFRRRRGRYRRRGSDGDDEPGGVAERFRRHAGMQALDLEPAVVASEDAERRDHSVDVSSRRDEIESLDERPPIVLRPPEDDAARRRHQHRAPGAARKTHCWMLVRADGAEVDPTLSVDLDTTQKRDVEPAACREVEEIGQCHQRAGAMQQRRVDGRNWQPLRVGVNRAGDVQVDEIRRVKVFRQERGDHRQRRRHAMEDRLAGIEEPGHGNRHHVPRRDFGRGLDHAGTAAGVRMRAAMNARAVPASRAATTASTRKLGMATLSGASANVAPSVMRSAVRTTRRAAWAINTSSKRVPMMRPFPSASASWTWRIATSGTRAGTT